MGSNARAVTIRKDDWVNLNRVIRKLSFAVYGADSTPTFGGLNLTGDLSVTGDVNVTGDVTVEGLDASRLVATDANDKLISSDLINWITGTANRVTVSDDSDGTVTLSGPQDIHTGASPTFVNLTLTGNLDIAGDIDVEGNIYVGDGVGDAFTQYAVLQTLSTSLTLPQTGANSSTLHNGDESWNNPTNIEAEAGFASTAVVGTFSDTDALYGSDFDFSAIPAGATITGIEVQISREGNNMFDEFVKLTKNGTAGVGDNKADTGTDWDGPSTATYGGSTDLWGTTWSVAEIQSSSFGAYVVAKAFGIPGQPGVAWIKVNVYYTADPWTTGVDATNGNYKISNSDTLGTSDVVEVRSTGINITGGINATGNIDATGDIDIGDDADGTILMPSPLPINDGSNDQRYINLADTSTASSSPRIYVQGQFPIIALVATEGAVDEKEFLMLHSGSAYQWSTRKDSDESLAVAIMSADMGTGIVTWNQDAVFQGDVDITGDLDVGSNTTLGGGVIYTPSSTQSYSAANTITVTNTIMRVQGNGGAVTLTSTPTIADGADGQVVYIQGDHDTNTLTLQDEGNLANSGLALQGGVDFTLGKGDILTLTYDAGDDKWYEISRSDN